MKRRRPLSSAVGGAQRVAVNNVNLAIELENPSHFAR